MIHLDRLHRAICRLTGRPFCAVKVSDVASGTFATQHRYVEINLEWKGHAALDRRGLRDVVLQIKKDHGWDQSKASRSCSQPCLRPAGGANGTPAADRRTAECETDSRERT